LKGLVTKYNLKRVDEILLLLDFNENVYICSSGSLNIYPHGDVQYYLQSMIHKYSKEIDTRFFKDS